LHEKLSGHTPKVCQPHQNICQRKGSKTRQRGRQSAATTTAAQQQQQQQQQQPQSVKMDQAQQMRNTQKQLHISLKNMSKHIDEQ